MDEKDIKVQSLHKSLKVLECFSANSPELGVTEISNMLGIYKSNVHNILTTFEALGYILKNPQTLKYSLSNKMLEYSYVITSQLNYQNVVYQVMKRLTESVNEMSYFGVPHGKYVLYMFNAYPKLYDNNYPIRSIMGEKAELYCTSIGKAMLLTMQKEEILTRLPQERTQYTENTLIETKDILKDIEESAKRGYAIDNSEHEEGLRCVGVPVIDRNHKLLGGLSISGSARKFTDKKIEGFAKELMDAAFEIRSRL